MRLLDPRFRYTPAAGTNVRATWERFGFRATTDDERKARQERACAAPAEPLRITPKTRPTLRLAAKKAE